MWLCLASGVVTNVLLGKELFLTAILGIREIVNLLIIINKIIKFIILNLQIQFSEVLLISSSLAQKIWFDFNLRKVNFAEICFT